MKQEKDRGAPPVAREFKNGEGEGHIRVGTSSFARAVDDTDPVRILAGLTALNDVLGLKRGP